MKFKIDTKEKFEVISIAETDIPANMAETLRMLLTERRSASGSLILDLSQTLTAEPDIAEVLLEEQQKSYDMQHSFVICCLTKELESSLDEQGVLELLNTTPTESEAWDIVQMEEIEREFLGD